MGMIEKKARTRRRWGAFQKGLLVAVAGTGLILVAAAAPNVLQLMQYFPGYKKGARFNFQAKSALSRLAAKGLIVFIEKSGKKYARITDAGKQVLQFETERIQAAKKRRWDRRWRIVLFDIPERRKSTRDRLRRFMDECDFVRLQDSAWVYPYDCEDLIALAKTKFRIGIDALYIIAESIERDKHLREHFHLPLD